TGATGAATDEFVELVNASDTAFDASGYRVAYRSAAGTSDTLLATLPAGTTIAAHGFYLLGGAGYAGSHQADQSFSAGLASTAGERVRAVSFVTTSWMTCLIVRSL